MKITEGRINAFKRLLNNLDIFNILDVGCGAGTNLTVMSKINDYNLTGLDISESNVRFIDKSFGRVIGDCNYLPFKDESFDLTLVCGLLDCYQEISRIVSEIARVSKKYIMIIDYEPKKFKHEIWTSREYNNLVLFNNFIFVTSYDIPEITDTMTAYLFRRTDGNN